MICKQIQSLTLCCSSMQMIPLLLFLFGKEVIQCSNTAIHVVNNLKEWRIINYMKCNFSKCKEMVFRKGKGKVCIRAKWPIRAGAYPSFRSMKRLGVFLLPPAWDASPSQGYPPALNSPVPIYTPGWREAL